MTTIVTDQVMQVQYIALDIVSCIVFIYFLLTGGVK